MLIYYPKNYKQNIEKLSQTGSKISNDCVKYEKSELNACTRKLDKILTSKNHGNTDYACNAWHIVLDNGCRCKLSERMVKQFVRFYKRETVYSLLIFTRPRCCNRDF